MHQAFNSLMQRELHTLWRALRRHDPVRCIVLTGAGDKAFCTGIDRMEQMGGEGDATTDPDVVGGGGTPFMFNDPGDNIGPKSCDLWKPVIAAVNGMACGGAFYMLGEVEFIVAAEHATFFDPHVTYGMTAAFEPIHMAGITPFPRSCGCRSSATTSACRRSAPTRSAWSAKSCRAPISRRAREIAAIIASQPRLAIEGTVRAIWSTRSMPQREAVRLGYAYVAMGTNQESISEGQKMFASGKRVEWNLR